MTKELLQEIEAGNTLLAVKNEDGTFDVWVAYENGGTSMSAYEDVPADMLEKVKQLHASKVSSRA